MKLIKINEQIFTEDIIDESKYNDVFCGIGEDNRRFKCFVIRKADAKNPAPSKRIKDNQGNEFPDHIEVDFDSAFNFAKNATAPTGHIFNKKKGSTIAYLRFSTQEGNKGDENTGRIFDKCDPNFTLLFMDGKLTSDSKKILDTLYVDTKNGNYVVDNSLKMNDDEAEKERIAKQVLKLQASEIKKVSNELKSYCGNDTWAIIPKEITDYFCICDDVITNSENKKVPNNGIIVQFERNSETGNIDYKKLSYFVGGKEKNSTDLSEKQIQGSKEAIDTLYAFYKKWKNEANEENQELPAKLLSLKKQLRFMLREGWEILKPSEQALKVVKDDTKESIVLSYSLSDDNVNYSAIEYIKDDKILKTKELSDIDEDSVNDVIVKVILGWLENTPKQQDASASQEQSNEVSTNSISVNSKQQTSTNVQDKNADQTKSAPISYVNAKNGVLSVKKGDYAIGSDGKLRLIKKNDANYATTAHGKAVRNLHIDRNLRDVLRNLELMESKKINEADEDKRLENIKNNETIQNLEATFDNIETNLNSFIENEVVKAFFENDEKNKPLFDNINGKKFDDAKAIILNLKEHIEDIKNIDIWQADQNKEENNIISKINTEISNLGKALIEAQNDAEELFNLKDNIAISARAVKDIESFNSHIEDAKKAAENAIQYLEKIEDTQLRNIDDSEKRKKEDQKNSADALEIAKNAAIDYNSAPKNIREILDSDSFKKEVEAYGSTETNPFIAFLLNAKKIPSVWSKLNISYYGVIHNAVAAKYGDDKISPSYLMSEKDTKLNCPNILLVTDLYEHHTASELKKYMEVRNDLASRVNSPVHPLTPEKDVEGVTMPTSDTALSTDFASKIIFKENEILRSIKSIDKIMNNLTNVEYTHKKYVSNNSQEITKELARQLNCKEDELANKAKELRYGMNVLLNRAFNTIPLDIAKVKEYAKKVGIDENKLFKDIEQDPTNNGWRKFFNADNIDNEKIVNDYITTVANILNSVTSEK